MKYDEPIKTIDGVELKEGDSCWVTLNCMSGEHHLSLSPRSATYMDEVAKDNGWQFTIRRLRVECDDMEITGIWKNRPARFSPEHD